MRVAILRGLEPVVVEGATRVVVYGDAGTPVAVTSEWTPGVILAGHAGEPGFTRFLAGLGIGAAEVMTVRPVTPDEIEI
jgi:hypothetical protein